MGRPQDALPSPSPVGESPSAISLHTTANLPTDHHPAPRREYFDDDPAEFDADDLPPLYSDHAEFSEENAPLVNPLAAHGGIGGGDDDDDDYTRVHSFGHSRDLTTTYFIDGRLDRDPDFLAATMHRMSEVPPRPFVIIKGTHKERKRRNDNGRDKGSTESKAVVDFELEIELTHLLYSDMASLKSWKSLNTASNFEKVRRGTILATRAPGFGGGGGVPEEGQPDVREWCRRYCASRAGLKCFTMERRVTGWDWDLVERRLDGLARATNYRGHVEITFPVRHSVVQVYNDCKVSRWRLTRWIEMVFMLTLMFLFSWPYLFFRTKRWETVFADWQLSRPTAVPGRKEYVSMNEEQWYAMWAKAIQAAMLERRRGSMTQGDIQATAADQLQESGEHVADGFHPAVRAGMAAMGAVNRSFGWGGDSW